MGLDSNGVKFLFYAKKCGVDFGRIAMLGRQGLHLSPAQLEDIGTAFGQTISQEKAEVIFSSQSGYAEELFAFLGAREIHSFDHSSYENATHLHDMNQPIPDQHKKKYSLVLDGGSLEHVFHFPTAIRNAMEMVEVGGYYLALTPANNFMGHGFYQFSPELYYSVFQSENGFAAPHVIALEDRPRSSWFTVKNPQEVGCRVSLTNRVPVFLFVMARRIEAKPIFASTPQQSDYVAAWQKKEDSSNGSMPNSSRLARSWSERVQRLIPRALRSSESAFDRRYFCPFDPTKQA
jgi:hypothetical protein